MLKVLQVANRVPWPLNDGGNIATYHVNRQLRRAGHDVMLASLNTLKHRQNVADIPDTGDIRTVEIDTSPTAWGLMKGYFDPRPYNVWRFWSPKFANLLRQLLDERDFDIVQLEGSYLSLYSDTIRRHSQAALVMRSHNVEHIIWSRLAKGERNALKRIYLNKLSGKIERFEREHLKDYDGIIPIADQDERYYRAEGFKGMIRTINAGVELETFSTPDPITFSPTFVFIGSFEWLPNLQGIEWFLEHVWPSLHEAYPQAVFHIAGKNPPPGFELGRD